MRKLCLILLPVFLLAACSAPGGGRGEEEQSQLTVLATTYPVYLFASALAENVDGVAVERLSTGQVSCLHDYTLSVDDMKKIQRADVIAMNGAELEEFMEDALSASVQGYIDAMVPVTVDLVYQQLEDQGMSRADIDEAMKAQGITVEEYVKQLFGALDVDQLTDGLDQENVTGYFRAAKGKLYTSEKENSFSQDDYAEYTLENGVMKWTGGSSALISDFGDIGVELPIEWVKQ